MANPLLKLVDISKYYSSADAVALGLRKINCEFNKGEFVAITGESGSGKSTLLNVLSGIDTYEEGELYFKGEETSCFDEEDWDNYRRENIAFVFQDYSLIDSYTVLQNVELSLLDNFPDKHKRRERALELLSKVDMKSHKNHKCTKLSGGQKQRVAIARALAKDAPIILADEPTGNLDSKTSDKILTLMSEIAKEKLLFIVTHDYEEVKDFATRKLRMFDGKLVEDTTVKKPNNEIQQEKIIKEDNNLKKDIQRSLLVAKNNILSTPKRSLFILTTSILTCIILTLFLFFTVNSAFAPKTTRMLHIRRDTMYVLKSDKSEITQNDLDKIQSIKGINYSTLDYALSQFKIGDTNILPLSNYDKKVPTQGRLPQNDNEIVLSNRNDISLIGKELNFSFIKKDSGSGNSVLTEKFKVVGFDNNFYNNYITDSAYRNLSKKIIENNNSGNYQMYMNNDKNAIYKFKDSKLKFDKNLKPNEVYIVFNPNNKLVDKNLITSFESNEYKPIDLSLFYDIDSENVSKNITLIPITPDTNAEIYNKYKSINNPTLVFNENSNLNIKNKTVALANINYKLSKSVINELEKNNFKIIYPYSAPKNLNEIISSFITNIINFLGIIFLIIIVVALLSEVYKKVSLSKLRDNTIFRTVGLSRRIIKYITYSEFIILNFVASLLTSVSIFIVSMLTYVIKNPNFVNFIYKYQPAGPFSVNSFIVYLSVFIIQIGLAFLITRKFNKKMMKLSVKQSLTQL